MSVLETVVITTNGYRPTQTHSRLVTWINILDDPEFTSEIYSHPEYDIFGFLPNGIEFSNDEIVSRIVNLFNQEDSKIALIYADCGAYFINKRIVPIDMKIESIEQLNKFIFDNELRSIKTENNIFKYD